MSGDVGAEVAAVLAGHRLHASMNICTGCDWRATSDAGSLADQHDQHRADALAPLIAQRVGAAKVAAETDWDEGQAVARTIAQLVEAAKAEAWSLGQLTGLDDYERNDGTLSPNPYRAAVIDPEGGS